ncbi:MAG: hypothetical protein CTY31_11795 [Hyphomicrobium sp.]|nr:MAG: hypothetical protein CTY31_11795 [Hyphomicrobium sp.]
MTSNNPNFRKQNVDETAYVSFREEGLTSSGFTESGIKQFKGTVFDFCAELLSKSVKNAEIEKSPNHKIEITHAHVQSAAQKLSGPIFLPRTSGYTVAAQVGEYICAAIAGAGAGHLDNTTGILAFGLGCTFGVLLIIYRLRGE